MPFSGDADQIDDAVRSFLTADQPRVADPRRLATVVFTDIVESTQNLARVGDKEWVAVLDAHDAAASRRAREHNGRLVKTTGDGTLAVFDGPAHAIHYALDLRRDVNELGLRMRAGLHAGEIHDRGDDVAGLAVHAAARVAALAPPDTIYASRTIPDLVAGIGRPRVRDARSTRAQGPRRRVGAVPRRHRAKGALRCPSSKLIIPPRHAGEAQGRTRSSATGRRAVPSSRSRCAHWGVFESTAADEQDDRERGDGRS
jgi:class 3 adenylate cyclase